MSLLSINFTSAINSKEQIYSDISQSLRFLSRATTQLLATQNASATRMSLLWSIAKMLGNLFFNAVSPHQMSYQKFILFPLPTSHRILSFKISNIFMLLFHALVPWGLLGSQHVLVYATYYWTCASFNSV